MTDEKAPEENPFPKITKPGEQFAHLARCLRDVAGKLSLPCINIEYLQNEIGRVLPDEKAKAPK